MATKKNNMPRFDFVPDDEFEERTVKLSKAKWAMLDKYCEFVEKKTAYRPSHNKVFDKLLDNLFGTDKVFRHNAGLIRPKKQSVKSKLEGDAQEATPAANPAAINQNAVTQTTQQSRAAATRQEPAKPAPVASIPARVDAPNQGTMPNAAPVTSPPQNVRPEQLREPLTSAQSQATYSASQQNPVRPSLKSQTAPAERAASDRNNNNVQPPAPQTKATESTSSPNSRW